MYVIIQVRALFTPNNLEIFEKVLHFLIIHLGTQTLLRVDDGLVPAGVQGGGAGAGVQDGGGREAHWTGVAGVELTFL